MMALENIRNFYPETLSENPGMSRHILKEYIQLLVLDFLSATPHARKLTFIGGTCLRLVKGIDRFSEDLDFDCKDFSATEFSKMSQEVLLFLRRNGYAVEARDKENPRLKAFRCSIHFPGLLFELGLSSHRDERFMLKLEAQDQGIAYERNPAFIKGCGLFFPFPIPTDQVLCAMKLSALLDRGKGRDFYDAMFLLSQTRPDYAFLAARRGIRTLSDLKAAAAEFLVSVDLKLKRRDFEHLLFRHADSQRILHAGEFFRSL